ncbi:MAG: hypothetical protein OHK93_002217 [Ramalina farinacea]|uniref:Uncharacterized protein n=1 Tax=Ramalina farinacea TaxID=258253 RepID=A0AA43U063_9LECA|nr:hypothetical protein [Ramalina farinacea]
MSSSGSSDGSAAYDAPPSPDGLFLNQEPEQQEAEYDDPPSPDGLFLNQEPEQQEAEYDAPPSADDVFIKQEPGQQEPEQQEPEEQATQPPTEPTLTEQLVSSARLLSREREAHAETFDTLVTRERQITRLRCEKEQLQAANAKLQEENEGLLGEKKWLEQDSDDLQAQVRDFQRALGGQNRNQRHSATQTDPVTVERPTEVDDADAANARPQDAATAPTATAAATATAPVAAPPAAGTAQYCSVCLHSVQNIPATTMRRHLEACGITAQDCVSLTPAQVKSQRKARRASKAAAPAGKKRSAEEGPVSGRLRKRVRNA